VDRGGRRLYPEAMSPAGREPVDETDGLETDGCTYAVGEQGDLLWFIPPSAYRRRRKREAEAAELPAEPDS
jgi:hypothetical protein